jgi:hypothetical protein
MNSRIAGMNEMKIMAKIIKVRLFWMMGILPKK